MQEKKNENRQLADILECRFLNADAAGVVLERIPQNELLRLYRWFTHEEGGKSGALLIDTAPILDTLIEVQAYLPAFITEHFPENDSGEADEVVDAGDGGGERPAQPGSESLHIEDFMDGMDLDATATPAPPPPGLPPGARRGGEGSSRKSPQMAAYGFFGSGLMWGAGYLEKKGGSDDAPFPLKGNISGFLEHVSQDGMDHLAEEKCEREATRVMSPAWLARGLVELCPALDIVLHSAYKLSRRSKEGDWESSEDGSHLRFLFFLGLLAAGLEVPALATRTGFSS